MTEHKRQPCGEQRSIKTSARCSEYILRHWQGSPHQAGAKICQAKRQGQARDRGSGDQGRSDYYDKIYLSMHIMSAECLLTMVLQTE